MFGSEGKEGKDEIKEVKKDTVDVIEVFAPEEKTSINEILSTTLEENKDTLVGFIALLKNTQSLHHLTALKNYPPEYRLQIATLLLKLNELSNEFGFADKESIEKLMTLFARDKTTTLPQRILIDLNELPSFCRKPFILDLVYLHAEHSPEDKDFLKKLRDLNSSGFLTQKYEGLLKEEIISHRGSILQFSTLWARLPYHLSTEDNKMRLLQLLKDNPELKSTGEERFSSLLRDLESFPLPLRNQDVFDLLLLNAQFSPSNTDFARELLKLANMSLLDKKNRTLIQDQLLISQDSRTIRFPFPEEKKSADIAVSSEIGALLATATEHERTMVTLLHTKESVTPELLRNFLTLPDPLRKSLIETINQFNTLIPHLINAINISNLMAFTRQHNRVPSIYFLEEFIGRSNRTKQPVDQDIFDLLFFHSYLLDRGHTFTHLGTIYNSGMLNDNFRDIIIKAAVERRSNLLVILTNFLEGTTPYERSYSELPHMVAVIKKNPGRGRVEDIFEFMQHFSGPPYRQWFEDTPLAIESAKTLYDLLTLLKQEITRQLKKENPSVSEYYLEDKISFRLEKQFTLIKAIFAHPNITDKNKYLSDLIIAINFLQSKNISHNYPFLMNHPEFLEKFVARLPKIRNKIKNQASFDKYMKENISNILKESLKDPFQGIKSDPITDIMAKFFFEDKKEEQERDLATGLTELSQVKAEKWSKHYIALPSFLKINQDTPFLNEKRVNEMLEYKDNRNNDRLLPICTLICSLHKNYEAKETKASPGILAEKLGNFLDRILIEYDQNDKLLSVIDEYLDRLKKNYYLKSNDYSSFEFILRVLIPTASVPFNERFEDRFGTLIRRNLLNETSCKMIENAFTQESKEVSPLQYASNQILRLTLAADAGSGLTERDLAIIERYPQYDQGIFDLLKSAAEQGKDYSYPKTHMMLCNWLLEEESIRILSAHHDFGQVFRDLRSVVAFNYARITPQEKDNATEVIFSLMKGNLKLVQDKPAYTKKFRDFLHFLRFNSVAFTACTSLINQVLSHPSILTRLDLSGRQTYYSLSVSINALEDTIKKETAVSSSVPGLSVFKGSNTGEEGKEEKKETVEKKEVKSDPKTP